MWSVRERPRLANPAGVAPHGCLGLAPPAGISPKRSGQVPRAPGFCSHPSPGRAKSGQNRSQVQQTPGSLSPSLASNPVCSETGGRMFHGTPWGTRTSFLSLEISRRGGLWGSCSMFFQDNGTPSSLSCSLSHMYKGPLANRRLHGLCA